jgi:stearoyl-CoA desaturase (delta-9 desaturase)
VLVTFVSTHLTIVSVTVYLHRNQAHRAVELHPIASHFFRFWLWLTTGMNTREWAAVHRKHHVAVETKDDPHSPIVHGIKKVVFTGTELYREGARDLQLVAQYGFGTPDDWIERQIYRPHSWVGMTFLLVLNFVLFGLLGITMWAVQLMWLPVFAAGIINGVGHWKGYRNFHTDDASTNIIPWGLLIGGEELHNNHHAFAMSAKFSIRPWEFDLGWLYIQMMSAIGLAKVKSVYPERPKFDSNKDQIDIDTTKAVTANRLHIMADFRRLVVKRVYKEELQVARGEFRTQLKDMRGLLSRAAGNLNGYEYARLEAALDISNRLKVVFDLHKALEALYKERSASAEPVLRLLKEWCVNAEESGIEALEEFAKLLKGYTVA